MVLFSSIGKSQKNNKNKDMTRTYMNNKTGSKCETEFDYTSGTLYTSLLCVV